MAQTVLVIKDATLKLASSQAALTAAVDYQCQVVSAAVNAVPKLQTVPATFCAPESQAPASTGWELAITILQDWGVTNSISQFLFDNDATSKWFRLQPNTPDAPGMEGQCWLVAGSFMGDAGTPLTATGTFPCLAKPAMIALVFSTGATAGTPGSYTPSGSDPPNSLADLIAGVPNAVTASPNTAWTTGQYILLENGDRAHWSGTAWVTGVA
jgi:hypothetical protein